MITEASLRSAMSGEYPAPTSVNYAALVPEVTDALLKAGCTTNARAAMFLAQIGAESGSLRWMEELADGSEYNGRVDLGNTHPGDGPRYKGRGPIQVTGRYNHTKVSEWAHSKGYVPTATYFVDHPTKLASPKYRWLGAVWYWTVARNMNSYADRNDIVGATRAVNGGLNNLSGRTARWKHCLTLGDSIVPTRAPGPRPAPQPTPPPVPTPVASPMSYRSGDTGKSVRVIQQRLNAWGPKPKLAMTACSVRRLPPRSVAFRRAGSSPWTASSARPPWLS